MVVVIDPDIAWLQVGHSNLPLQMQDIGLRLVAQLGKKSKGKLIYELNFFIPHPNLILPIGISLILPCRVKMTLENPALLAQSWIPHTTLQLHSTPAASLVTDTYLVQVDGNTSLRLLSSSHRVPVMQLGQERRGSNLAESFEKQV